MKKTNQLWKPFFTKEKGFILLMIFILINISIYYVFKNSVFSYDGYGETYPNAALSFYYYLHCIGVNVFIFCLFMLLLPNLISYDVLNLHQSHAAYLIEIRKSRKNYYIELFIKNILMTFLSIFIMEILILIIIHFFYFPIQFNMMSYPEDYYITSQLLSSNEALNLALFVFITAIGYATVSSLIFSLQMIITNKYIYRCFGVIFGILLVLLPALIQGFLPVPDFAFLLQINNLVALGIENVRANPFYLPHILVYIMSLIIYACLSFYSFKALLKWRQRYD